MSETTRILAGILLLSLVTVESGGLYLVKLVRGAAPATPFQLGFARAGHAHAAVLLMLSLTDLLYADAAQLTGPLGWLSRIGVPSAALLIRPAFLRFDGGEPHVTQRIYRPGLCRRDRPRRGARIAGRRAAGRVKPGPTNRLPYRLLRSTRTGSARASNSTASRGSELSEGECFSDGFDDDVGAFEGEPLVGGSVRGDD